MKLRHPAITLVLAATLLFNLQGCAALNDSLAYKQGTRVTDEQLASFKNGVTTRQQILDTLGGPQDIKMVGSKEHLIYRYTQINHFGPNEGRTVTFVLSNKKLVEKLVSKNNPTGNPLTGQ